MSFLLRTVQKEKERVGVMIAAYQRQLDELPKGSIVVKTVGNNAYYYLKYRNGKKVVTDYIGKDGERLESIRKELDKRHHIEMMIAYLRSEQSLADKVLGGKRDTISWQ